MPLLKKLLKYSAILVGVLVVALVGLVAYAGATADGRLQFDDAARPTLAATADAALIAEGSYLVHGPAHCAQCHSTADREHPELISTTPLQGGLAFAMGPLGTRYARNLTPHPTTGLGNVSDADIARTLRTGVMHDGELSFFMRYSAANLSEHDIVAVISYLRSIAPVDNAVDPGSWALFGKVLLTYAFPPLTPRPGDAPEYVAEGSAPSVERGEYLAQSVMLCTSCHTEFDMATFEPVGPTAAGSLPDPSHGSDHGMEFVAPNLTSHPTGITGQLSEDAFVARLRGGRVYASSIMPWENFAATHENDLRSVYRYLTSLPPVDADRGPTYRQAGWVAGDEVVLPE
jgi:mono/diheme cytochrome c family protein